MKTTIITKTLSNACLSAFIAASLIASANAAVIVTITEEGSDLLFSYDGQLDTTNATFIGDTSYGVDPAQFQSNAILNRTGASTDGFQGDFRVSLITSRLGSIVGHSGQGDVFSPVSEFLYLTALDNNIRDSDLHNVSGSFIIPNESFVSAGLDIHPPDQLIPLWAANATTSNPDEMVFLVVGTIPEPSSAVLLGVASLGLALRRRRI